MVEVYEADAVTSVKTLHAELLAEYPGRLTVRDVVERQSKTLLAAHGAGDRRACVQLGNGLPRAIGRPAEEILAAPLDLVEARTAVAVEHGWADWPQVESTALDSLFEEAADAVVNGDLDKVSTLLREHPELVRQRSPYGHRATLLHYVAANGVEIWRQTVPSNAVAVTTALLDAGSDPEATMPVYRGDHTTLALLLTSDHPHKAGLTGAIADLLRAA